MEGSSNHHHRHDGDHHAYFLVNHHTPLHFFDQMNELNEDYHEVGVAGVNQAVVVMGAAENRQELLIFFF